MNEREQGSDAPAVLVRDLCFSYGGNEALHNVSFEIPRRALAAVVGPNGGGKTTLLRLLLGELRPRFGEVRVLGEAPERARRRVGFVPQSAEFDPDFPITVLESVMLGRGAARACADEEKASDTRVRSSGVLRVLSTAASVIILAAAGLWLLIGSGLVRQNPGASGESGTGTETDRQMAMNTMEATF